MRLSIALLATLLLVAVLAGPAAAQGKTDLTVALSSFSTEVLDPVLGGHVVKYYMSLMFDYLVGVTPDGQLSKDSGLATRWENSADYKRWTFYLRKGVKFHTGEEATSEDVKFSLQRAIGKRSTTGYAGPLRTLIVDIETPAPDRVVIVTKDPTLIIPTYLSRSLSTEGMILPKKYLEAIGDDAFAQKPVGSGPYKFVEQVTGSHIKLAAVDNHWRIGVPRFKTVTFKLVPEETTRIALLRRGEVDIADVSRDRVKELERESFPIHFRREEAILTRVVDPAARRPADQGQARARGAEPRHRPQRDRPVDLRRLRRSGVRAAGALVGVSRHRLQGDARDAVPVRSGSRQEAARRSRVRERVPAHDVRLSAPRAARGQGVRRGRGRVLAEGRRPAEAGPRRLSGVPQELVRSRHPRSVRLLQRGQPRLDRRLRLPREAGVHQVEGGRHRERSGDRRHDRAGHAADRQGEDRDA